MIYPRQNLTREQKGEVFTGHLPLAHKFAGQFSRKFGIPLDTMTTEAISLLSLIVANWDGQPNGYNPTKTKPTTYLYRTLYYGLLDYVRRGQCGEDRLAEHADVPRRATWLERLLRTLGEDARAVVSVILFAPAEIAEAMEPPVEHARERVRWARERSRLAVHRYFAERDWSEERVDAAWYEVAVAL